MVVIKIIVDLLFSFLDGQPICLCYEPYFQPCNPYPAKLIFLNFQPLKVVSRYRDAQPKVAKNNYICLIWDKTFTNLFVQTVISFPTAVGSEQRVKQGSYSHEETEFQDFFRT